MSDTPTPNGQPPNDERSKGQLPTVLFVDDEQAVLDGLRSSLRKLRRTYRLLFATGADEALALLEREDVDMVVTDMRMPGRTGVDLLEEIQFRFPDVIRYVLSGQAEDRLVRRSVPVTHRWLNKPLDRNELIEALAEATGHRAQVDDDEVRQALASIDALPTPDGLRRRLLDLAAGSDPTPEDFAELAAVDPAMTAKLLQWANAAYSTGTPTVDVGVAVRRIGAGALAELVPAEEMVRCYAPTERVPGYTPEMFQRRAGAVSSLAARLARPEDAGLATAAGLLVDVGLLVEVGYLRRRLDAAYEEAERRGASLVEIERERWGMTHPELGGHLLGLWGLPTDLVDAVSSGHRLPAADAEPPFPAATAVQAARLLAERLPHAEEMAAPHRERLDRLGDELNASIDRWWHWAQERESAV